MTDSNLEGRTADLELALRQIMNETGVPRMSNGQPLYDSAWRSGLAAFVRKVIDERERTGWIAVAHSIVVLLWAVVILTFLATVLHVR